MFFSIFAHQIAQNQIYDPNLTIELSLHCHLSDSYDHFLLSWLMFHLHHVSSSSEPNAWMRFGFMFGCRGARSNQNVQGGESSPLLSYDIGGHKRNQAKGVLSVSWTTPRYDSSSGSLVEEMSKHAFRETSCISWWLIMKHWPVQ